MYERVGIVKGSNGILEKDEVDRKEGRKERRRMVRKEGKGTIRRVA